MASGPLRLKADIGADVSGFRAGATAAVRATDGMATSARGAAAALDTAATAATGLSEATDRQASVAHVNDNALISLTSAVHALTAATQGSAAATTESTQASHAQATAMTALVSALDAVTRAEDARAAAARRSAAEADRAAAADRGADDRLRRHQDYQAQLLAERAATKAAADAEVVATMRARDAYVPLHRERRLYVEELARIRAEQRAGRITTDEATAAIRREKGAFASLIREVRGAGSGSVTLAGWQKRNLLSQGFDTFTSLLSGMPPWLIAAQQGPQAIEAAGGPTAALTLVRAAITPVTAAVTAAAAAVVIGGAAWNGYLTSTKAVAAAQAGLGRNIGATSDELDRIARASASAAGISVRSARAMQVAFLSTGRIGAEQYAGLIGISKNFGATIGTDAETAAAKLADLFRDPARGAQALSQELGLLDGATARYVQRLAAAGQEERARSALLAALPTRLASAAEATTAWSRAWDQVATSAGNAWDAIGKAIDRAAGFAAPPTPQQKVEAAADKERAILYQERNVGTKNRPVMVWERKPTADAIEERAARLTTEDLRTDGPRKLTGSGDKDPYRSEAIALLNARRGGASARADQRAQDDTAAQDRVRAQSDAAVTRAYGVAQGSAGASTEQTRRRLEREIEALQGGLASGALGDERADITATLEAKRRALAGLETQQARNAELDRLDIRIQTERNPLARAALVARQAELRIGAEEITDKEASARIEQARIKAYAEATAQVSASARDRARAADEEIAAIDREAAAIGQTAGQIAAAEAAARALAEAKAAAGAAGVIDPAELARIERYAAAVGAAADRTAAARLQSDLDFERAQLDRAPGEREIAARLRSAQIDPASIAGQRAAADMRATQAIEAQRDAISGLVDDLGTYIDRVGESGDAWESAGDLATDTLKRIAKELQTYALNQMFGVPQDAPAVLQWLGIGKAKAGAAATASPPATATPAATAVPATYAAPAGAAGALPAPVSVSALPALQAAYRGRAGGLEGMDPAFAGRMDAFLAANPGVTVTSAYRTPEQQRVLWEAALKKYGSPELARKNVAPPGRSYHNKGLAADLGYASPDAIAQAHASAGQYGLTFPLKNERWHIEPAGARGGTGSEGAAAAIDRLATSADSAASATGGLGTGFEALSSNLQGSAAPVAQAASGLTGAAAKLGEGATDATQSAQGLFGAIGSGLDNLISGIGNLFSGGGGEGGGDGGGSAGGLLGGIAGFIASIWPFEAGGIMTARGPVPLRAYAAGGIANSPQLALYGEGQYAEAYVPLPDGRSIPVTMRAQGGGVGQQTTMAISQLAGQIGLLGQRLAAGVQSAPAGGSSGGGSATPIAVQVIDNVGARVSAHETTDASGKRRLDVVIDEQVARAARRPGSKTKAALAAASTPRRR